MPCTPTSVKASLTSSSFLQSRVLLVSFPGFLESESVRVLQVLVMFSYCFGVSPAHTEMFSCFPGPYGNPKLKKDALVSWFRFHHRREFLNSSLLVFFNSTRVSGRLIRSSSVATLLLVPSFGLQILIKHPVSSIDHQSQFFFGGSPIIRFT